MKEITFCERITREFVETTSGEGLSSKSCEAKFLLANNAPRYPGDGKMLSCVPRARKHQSPTSCAKATPRKPLPVRSMGMDLVGPFPQAAGQRKFLFVAIVYFTKWVEAEPLAKITEKEVTKTEIVAPTEIRELSWRVKHYDLVSNTKKLPSGDLVLRKAKVSGPVGKLDPKWEEPYKVVEIVNEGAYKLQ
ncbi:UNVERIFIED_CONTAM: hypothetical protein Scaly_3049700 [Sesamum calycinum]|uniref:Reverse transcriptase domain-containing protein n=1 Tax=Sesamum calycinum TaxID=2727403 RepID=A0AAW2K359_9LAMI